MCTPQSQGVMLERDFASSVIAEKARLFCCSAVGQLRVERVAREQPATRSGVALQSCREVADREGSTPAEVPDAETASLRALAEGRRNKRLTFFNSADGITL